MRALLVTISCVAVSGCEPTHAADPPSDVLRPAVRSAPASRSGSRAIDERALRRLGGAEITARVATSPVRVLAPATPELRVRTVTVEPSFYALTARGEHVTVTVQASPFAGARGEADLLARLPSRATVRGAPALVTVNEGIRSAAWVEEGAAYVVDVACDAPNDRACTTSEFVVAVASELAYVGGGAP